ncbi:NYN domain-containing protein [Candidatus Neptunochlamydia vexilliferae]|uniref:YacP-like NYN domain protein n=1 Tax=Candidatus Neptunichlamydia vexilliferae TaxID=1651774 RepID=A0ABS0B156_9BACT|nr:NYN domain-containing protein [Candidatus Neptunochlamydia vexilliferae]MBF5060146.1 hypothetical protein [Candidatus Neptunochlamydia vexilliferae]
MRYIIDGYNFFFKLEEDVLPLEKKRESFIAFLDEEARNLNILLVFDSHEQNAGVFATKRKLKNIEVSFSPKNLSADAYILELLEWDAKDTTLVTSDKPLAKKASYLGVKTLSINGFVSLMVKKQKKPSEKPEMRETEANIKRLLKEFNREIDEP